MLEIIGTVLGVILIFAGNYILWKERKGLMGLIERHEEEAEKRNAIISEYFEKYFNASRLLRDVYAVVCHKELDAANEVQYYDVYGLDILMACQEYLLEGDWIKRENCINLIHNSKGARHEHKN
jgi:hypothetical protein